MIAQQMNIDSEVVEISALLHDIAMTDISLDRSKHNEYGAEIASKILQENNYPEDKINLVKKCILNHSSKRKEFRTTVEEDSIKFVKEKLTKVYNEISEEVKDLIKEKYTKVMIANKLDDLKKYK